MTYTQYMFQNKMLNLNYLLDFYINTRKINKYIQKSKLLIAHKDYYASLK